MSLRVYKTIKATAQLVGVAAGVLAIQQGADPGTIYPLIVAILVGPEFLEYSIAETGTDE